MLFWKLLARNQLVDGRGGLPAIAWKVTLGRFCFLPMKKIHPSHFCVDKNAGFL